MNLWIVRHAKSSWADPGQADFDRPLNARGMKDGKRMMRWMRGQAASPQCILASDAMRARATADFVREGFSVPPDRLLFDHRLYLASPDTLMEIVRELPDDCPSVALVGHNPGSTEFANAIVGRAVIGDLPTFGMVLVTLPKRWSDARFGDATFVALQTPKTLRD
jgi:phosphohistidine phosphatase